MSVKAPVSGPSNHPAHAANSRGRKNQLRRVGGRNPSLVVVLHRQAAATAHDPDEGVWSRSPGITDLGAQRLCTAMRGTVGAVSITPGDRFAVVAALFNLHAVAVARTTAAFPACPNPRSCRSHFLWQAVDTGVPCRRRCRVPLACAPSFKSADHRHHRAGPGLLAATA